MTSVIDVGGAVHKRHKVKSRRFTESNGDDEFNASGVVRVDTCRFVFIDNHDGTSVFELVFDADCEEVEEIRRRRLVGVADGELTDPEGLARVDEHGATFLIATSSLCVTRGGHANDGLVRIRYRPDGDLQAEPMAGFRAWLLGQDALQAHHGIRRPDAGGFNIEGLAWDPRARALLFGLRGPADAGRVTLIHVPVDVGAPEWTTAVLGAPSLIHVETPDPAALLGVRDISHDDDTDDFLILLGRSLSKGDEPFELCRWKRGGRDMHVLDTEFHRSMKPEGVTAFRFDDRKKFLIVDDRGGYAVIDQ